jgi:glycerate 2-kinase
MRAGQMVSEALTGLDARTLVLACISGGASALMISPYPGIQLRTMQAINEALLKCGADITELNIVRSRLERLKSGGLVKLASPAMVVGLILSDVIGDPLSVIASGLTNHPDAHNVLVANNTQACEAAAVQARPLGYTARIVTTELRGEARERGREIAAAIMSELPGTCLIYGGEPTVTVHGPGKGGRNQELALAAAITFEQHPDAPACLVALGTDGTDGPTDAAGAMTFPDTLARAAAQNLDAPACLESNNSYHFYAPLGDLIMTGPTGTNVADVIIAIRL